MPADSVGFSAPGTAVAAANDWVVNSLDTMFAPGGLLAAVFGVFNGLLAAVAGLLVLWLAARAVIDTARHGVILGKHNETWAPIRFFVAVALFLPVPTSGGFNVGQMTIIGISKMGSAWGNKVWEAAGEATKDMRPLVTPTPPVVWNTAHGLWLMISCLEGRNIIAAASDGTRFHLVRHELADSYVLSADGDEPGQCGAVLFPKPSEANSLLARVQRDQIAATVELAESMRGGAREQMDILLPPYEIGDPNRRVNFEVGPAVTRYAGRLQQSAAAFVAANNQQRESREAFAREVAVGGWTSAGIWPWRIMAANAELTAALNKLPGVQNPRLDTWQSDMGQEWVAALHGADLWWSRRAGEANHQIAQAAYGAASEDSMFAFIDLARWRGLYETFSVDTQTAVNPMAEITKLGHGLINFTGASLATYGVIKAAGDTIAKVVESVPIVGKRIVAVGSALTGAATAVAGGPENANYMFMLAMGVLWMCGIGLAFILPAMPVFYWLLLVGRFMSRAALGMVATPLWALAHLDLDDSDGMGAKTKHGYHLLLDLLVRPMASILAFLIALALFIVMAKLFAQIYYPAVRATLHGHFGGLSGMFVFTVLGASFLVWLMRWIMLRAIDGVDDVMEFAGVMVSRTAGGTPAETAAQGEKAAAVAVMATNHVNNASNAVNRPRPGGGAPGGGGDDAGSWASPSTIPKATDGGGRKGE